MTIGRDDHSKSETVTVAAIESGVPLLVEAWEAIAAFHALIRKKSLADLDPVGVNFGRRIDSRNSAIRTQI
jgi:hypothetical protein